MSTNKKYGMELDKLIKEVRDSLRKVKTDYSNEIKLGGSGSNLVQSVKRNVLGIYIVDFLLMYVNKMNMYTFNYTDLYCLAEPRRIRALVNKCFKEFDYTEIFIGKSYFLDVVRRNLRDMSKSMFYKMGKKYYIYVSAKLCNKLVALNVPTATMEDVEKQLRRDGYGAVQMYDSKEERDVFVLVHK